MEEPAPETEPSPSPSPLELHVADWRTRLPEGFTMVVEAPFVVLGDDEPAVVQQHAERTVRWAVRLLRKDFFARDPGPLDIWLFRNRASYERNCRERFGGPPSTPFGWYSPHHRALIMNIATGGGTLVHEIVHPYMEANFKACPSWLNEGLGSLFEQCREVDGHIRGMVNWRLDGLQEAIRDERTVPLRTLLAMNRDTFYGARSGLHYAEARYLLYWLQEHDLLLDFWRRVTSGDDPSGATALAAVLAPKTIEQFEPEWRSWVLGLRRE